MKRHFIRNTVLLGIAHGALQGAFIDIGRNYGFCVAVFQQMDAKVTVVTTNIGYTDSVAQIAGAA
jgi:hypothetical protein